MQAREKITVHSCKYDGRIQRKWQAQLARREDSLIVLDGVFAEEIHHPILGIIAEGTLSTEYFWTDRWYGIFCFCLSSGQLRNYYCNINTPVLLEEGILTFIDLDIDVLVNPDFSFQILDEEEFEEHARLYNYPKRFRTRAQEAMHEIISLIQNREFPFSQRS
jgi:protein associated with RNAse G/E